MEHLGYFVSDGQLRDTVDSPVEMGGPLVPGVLQGTSVLVNFPHPLSLGICGHFPWLVPLSLFQGS